MAIKTRSEHEEQAQLVKWFDIQHKQLRGKLAAVPNASMCPVHVGAKMNKEGRRKGYPDLQLLYPSNGYHGLIIEMKKEKGGSVSKEQKDFIQWFNSNGYKAVICKGFEEAKNVIQDYLDVKG